MKGSFVLYLFSILLILQGCASTSTSKISKSSSPGGRPEWIDSPMDSESGCPETELCAVGEGAGKMVAEANARNALAQIFETRIKGSSTVTSTSDSKSSSRGLEGGSMSETTAKQIEELTDEVLKGVTIKKSYTDPKLRTVFALASLNKEEGMSRLRTEMKTLDTEMEELVKDGKRADLNKALKVYEKREAINQRYAVLAGSPLPAKVSLSEVKGKKRSKAREDIAVYVEFEAPKEAQDLRNMVVGLLTDNDYKVIEDDQAPHQFTVQGELTHEREHLNVEGFEKHKFILKVRSMNKDGAKLGGLDHTISENGRSFENCLGKALPALKQYLKDNLSLLKMD